ncbi:hypothetical protein [Actinomycetospora chiangmaiensis]|uniref:hypothetical protein n=1 Tax=Actinomycetospora chiangmaiensis TaxID=402650 RepID=UPI000381AFD5|nr:hypothetical protein [Actinomycetospora chiangmaiensis]
MAGWIRPWFQLVEISVSAPIVIGVRTARIVMTGRPPGPAERREMRRMVTEKARAFTQAGHAALTRPPSDVAGYLGGVLAPVHRTVRSNRRRLIRV